MISGGGAERQKTPNEIALNILLVGLDDHLRVRHRDDPELRDLCGRRRFDRHPGGAVRHLDPTTIGALLSASASPAWIGWCASMC